MTESDYLSGRDPEAMLALVGARLSTRRWHLLSAAVTRRLWDHLPAGPLREAVEWVEQHAGTAHTDPAAGEWLTKLGPAADTARDEARTVQYEVVKPADPDADPDSFQHTDARRTNPAAPLFQAACRYASNSLDQATEAAGHAATVVAALVETPPGPAQLTAVRAMVVEATRVRAAANLDASSALKLKAEGDEAADLDNRKNVNVRYAAALQTVTNEEESAGARRDEVEEQKEKADRKAAARFVHEIAGNPFKPFRFDPAWRTDTVVGLATAIDAGRHFDRMPILADALLDADCDEETVLRHCRGTEAHAPDGPAHARGCWVIDLILGRETTYFDAPPLVPSPPPPPAPPAKKPAPALGGMDRLFAALRQADDEDDV